MPGRSISAAGRIAAFCVAGLLALFIAYPIGAVLVESLVIRGPMPPARMEAVTQDALARLSDEEREALARQWVAGATLKERVEATATAFTLVGIPAPWDRKAPYTDQGQAMAQALQALAPAERAAVEGAYPIAHVMLHKRIALAFKVRDQVTPAEFDRLRSGTDDRIGLDHYLSVFQDRYVQRAALNSVALATATTSLTIAVALVLAFGLNAGLVPAPGIARAVLLLPLVAPPVLVATATIMLFGRRGLVTFTLFDQTLGVIDADETNLYGPIGVVLAQTLSSLPAALIVFDNIFRKHSGRLDEAAANLGARASAVFGQVTLPLAWPAIKRAAVLVFILSLTDFGNPELLGGNMPVLAGIVYDQILAYRNTPLAAALCVWLIVPPLLVYVALEWFGRRKAYAAGDANERSELSLPKAWRLGATTLVLMVGGAILIIYATMTLGALTRIWGVDWTFTLGHFTEAGIGTGHAGTGYGSSDRGLGLVWDSIRIAAVAAPIGGLMGIVVAYIVERVRPTGSNVLTFLALIPAIVPGIIFGVGYIIAFNAPFGIKALSLTGTSAILVVNIVFSNLFVGFLAARSALARTDPALDDAAEGLGAGLLARFIHVTLPLLQPALLLGTLYVFIDALTTFSSVVFLVSGNHKLASIAVFNHASSGEFGLAGAKSVALLAAALAAMALLRWVEQRRARRLPVASARAPSLGAVDLAAGISR